MSTPATRLVNSGDSSDAANYIDFDSYAAGAPKVWALPTLAERWNAAHADSRVDTFGNALVRDPAPMTRAMIDTNAGVNRVLAAVQLVGGGVEFIVAGGALLVPEPTMATKVVGVVLLTHSLDTMGAAVQTLISGNRSATFTQKGAEFLATEAGASPATAQTIGVVTDVTIGVAGTFGVGALSRVGAGGTQLVHLTSKSSATAIQSSQTLGLGKSTLYAGPEALAQAKGWSIVGRTGIPASKATDVILLPSKANQAFLMVKPIGPFSLWQRVNGTVFSASAGSLNLQTGVFTGTGTATNQLMIYGFDAAVGASMRAAPVAGSPDLWR